MTFQKKCRLIYTVIFVLLLLGSFLAFNPAVSFPKFSTLVSTNLQQLLIIAGLGGLPGVLIWSSKQVKKLKKNPDEAVRLVKYSRVTWARLAVFTLLGLFTLFLQLFTSMNGGLMFMMVILVLFIFIWPTQGRLTTEMAYAEKAVPSDPDQSLPDPSDSPQEPLSREDKDDWLPH